MTQKGYIDPAALDLLIDTYQTKVGPRNGARVVARAWVDPAFRERLLRDATADRKSTRLNSSHSQISYAVFCLKKKKKTSTTKYTLFKSRMSRRSTFMSNSSHLLVVYDRTY